MPPKDKIIKIRISGIGGQGIILMGYVLGKAAVVFDKITAVQTQSYGPEMRGTKCKSDLILSYNNIPIHYPIIEKANILVVMSQEAWLAYNSILQKDSIVFYDPDLIKIESKSYKLYPVAALQIAVELGNRIVANMVMLGALVGATEVVSQSALEQAVSDSVPESLKDLNLAAIKRGYDLVEQ